MDKETTHDERLYTLDGVSLDTSSMSKKARDQLSNLEFVDKQILQKNNELQIADSARIVYTSVLRADLEKL